MLIEEEGKDQHYVFTLVESPSFPNISSKDMQQKLTQWGLMENLEIVKFRFDIAYSQLQGDKFVKDFFNSLNVRKALGSLLTILPNSVDKVTYNPLSVKVTSLDFFDCLQKYGIVKAGSILKDYEETYEGISVCDKLRQALLLEESDAYMAFTTSDRNEFIYRLFSNIVIGGGMCQYEDYIEPYLTATKLFYKDLLSVCKGDSGDIMIKSDVLEIKSIDDCNLYKNKDNPQNFIYLIIDTAQRSVTFMYHKWVGYWG